MYKALTFLTHLYALCEQFCATRPPEPVKVGRKPTLTLPHGLALCLLCQWREFASERGFNGGERHLHWAGEYAADILCPPRPCAAVKGEKTWHVRHTQLRPIIATVPDKLRHTFRLERERPHHLSGLYARLCAKPPCITSAYNLTNGPDACQCSLQT